MDLYAENPAGNHKSAKTPILHTTHQSPSCRSGMDICMDMILSNADGV